MSGKRLWELSIPCSEEAEEALSGLLERLFGAAPTVCVDLERSSRQVRVYLSRKPLATSLERQALAAGLSLIRRSGLALGPARPRVKPIAQEDWARSWKRHFRPWRIGSKLLVKPSWSRQRATRGQAVVVLDPGLAFGTGQHPTTAFCLRELVWFRRPGEVQSFLDAGTGTGILAIAAAKLGYEPVEGFDHDPLCLKVAGANARRNRVQGRVRFRAADLAELPVKSGRRFDLVCANLVLDLLLECRAQLVGRMAGGGRLVVAGVLRGQFEAVRGAYAGAGLHLASYHVEAEWASGAFQSVS